MKRILVLSIMTMCTIVTIAFAAEPVLVWDKTYNTGEDEQGNAVAVDQAGNVYVAGQVLEVVSSDALIVAYDAGGNVLWNDVYDGGFGYDYYHGVAVDDQGYIYAAGSTYNGTDLDMLIVKYNPSGDTVWTFVNDIGLPTTEWHNEFFGIAVDEVNVYATGYYNNEITDIIWTHILKKEDASYVMLKGYDSGDNDRGHDIAVDGDGYVYVAGYSGHNYRIIKYDQNLDTIWNEVYDAGDEDEGRGIALDDEGYIYCSGSSGQFLVNLGYHTIRCDNDGNRLWGRTYDPDSLNMGYDVAVDDDGIYVTGLGFNISPEDTMYNPVTICYDREGNLLWETVYENQYGAGKGTFADNQGFMYVTGVSVNLLTDATDMLTLKYELVTGVEEQLSPSLPFPVSVEILDNLSSAPTVHYSLPETQPGILIIYSADGRRILEETIEGKGVWDASALLPQGVYFARVKSNFGSAVGKVVLLK